MQVMQLVEKMTISTEKARTENTKVPKDVISGMKKVGACIDSIPAEGLFSVSNVKYGDAAWKIFEEWANKVEADPFVSATFNPRDAIRRTALVPPNTIGFDIVREAMSIISQYEGILIDAFANGNLPPLNPPFGPDDDIPDDVRIAHASVALSHLMTRIQSPPDNFPVLSGLKAGSYICTIAQVWSNVTVRIALFKPE